MKINSSKFGFNFFLSGRLPVQNLDQAAKQYGNATLNLDTDEMYSNVSGGEFISLRKSPELNTASVYIPVSGTADKALAKSMVSEVVQRVYQRFGKFPVAEKGLGSWQADNGEVVYGNIVIVSVFLETVTESDIRFFTSLARDIKRKMKQEAVSIGINDALALV